MSEEKKLHRRIEIAIEDGEYREAGELARRAVTEDPCDGIGWYFLLLAENQVDHPEALLELKKDWRQHKAYQQVMACQTDYTDRIKELGRQWAYQKANELRLQHRFEPALAYFEEAGDYEDSAWQAEECRMIVEEARANERRLAEELEAREAEEQEQARRRTESAKKAAEQGQARRAENAQRTAEQGQARRAENTQRRAEQGQALETGYIESAEKLCWEYLSFSSDTEEKDIRELTEACRSLSIVAKWGGSLEDSRAYQELAKVSPFWLVYGAEQKEGALAAQLYDAEQGALAGLPWDDRLACYWAGVAASQGDKKGCQQLGRYYECGVGVEPNFKLAGHFYQAADSRTDVLYFRDLFRANREYCGSAGVVDELEEVTAPPNFEMTDAALRTGSYWKLHKRAETARMKADRRTAARMQELLRPLQGEFDDMTRINAHVDRKEAAVDLKAMLFTVLLGIPWTIFVLFMPRFVGIYGNLWRIPGIITLIFVYFLFYAVFQSLFELPQKRRERKRGQRRYQLVQKIRKVYDQAREETQQENCEEYQEYTRWSAKAQKMQSALGIKTSGWRHAYLMYYGAGVCGAGSLDGADQYAQAAARKGSAAKLTYVPAPIMRWLMQKMVDEDKPQDLLELAVQYGRNSRNRYNATDSWKPVFALECILLHAKFWDKFELENDNGFWRTNPKLLDELAGIYYGYGAKVKKEKPAISRILVDFAAEACKDQYRAGRKAALNDLVQLYSRIEDSDEAKRWAMLAWKERCPEFARNAAYYLMGYGGDPENNLFTKEELRAYANDVLSIPDLSADNWNHVQRMLETIQLYEKAEKIEEERQRERREMLRSYRESMQREAVEKELDRRERSLNVFLGDGYMTNQDLYLTGSQSLSDYVDNEIYRNFRRSELEKKAREGEM